MNRAIEIGSKARRSKPKNLQRNGRLLGVRGRQDAKDKTGDVVVLWG